MAAAAAGAAPGALAVVAPGMTLEQVIREAQVGLLVCLWSGCVWGGSAWVHDEACSKAARHGHALLQSSRRGILSCEPTKPCWAPPQASRDPIWVHESLLPLWLIKAYEERVREGRPAALLCACAGLVWNWKMDGCSAVRVRNMTDAIAPKAQSGSIRKALTAAPARLAAAA